MTFPGPKNFVSDVAIQSKYDERDESQILDAEEVRTRRIPNGKGNEESGTE